MLQYVKIWYNMVHLRGHVDRQYNMVQYGTVWYSMVQYGNTLYPVDIQYNTCSKVITVEYILVHLDIVQYM